MLFSTLVVETGLKACCTWKHDFQENDTSWQDRIKKKQNTNSLIILKDYLKSRDSQSTMISAFSYTKHLF